MINPDVEAYLAHYGVPGMKWGQRKKRGSSGRLDTSKLSDQELKSMVERLRLEDQFRDLSKKNSGAGKKYMRNLLEKSGAAIATAIVGTAAKRAVEKTLGSEPKK